MSERPSFGNRVMNRREFAKVALGMVPCMLPCCTRGVSLDGNYDSVSRDDLINDVFRKVIASEMNSGMVQYEHFIAERKERLFKLISAGSRVLEVGLGTGPNFGYLAHGTSVIGIEPNTHMWHYASQRAEEFGIDLELVPAQGENIPLSDASVDAVVTTLTLCTVADVTSTLNEIARVLRPGGVYIFVEHVLAPTERPVLRAFQNFLNPVQELFAGGCHLNRDTGTAILHTLSQSMSCIYMECFDARLGGSEDALSLIRPHIAGYGQKKV